MEYVCVDARFKFFNGQKNYTVMFQYALTKWYVFNDEETSGALWWKEVNPAKSKTPSRIEAANIFEEFLEALVVS